MSLTSSGCSRSEGVAGESLQGREALTRGGLWQDGRRDNYAMGQSQDRDAKRRHTEGEIRLDVLAVAQAVPVSCIACCLPIPDTIMPVRCSARSRRLSIDENQHRSARVL